MKKVLSVLLVLILVVGLGGYLLATTADASQPGDTLFSVDLFAEKIQRAISFSDIAKMDLEQAILDERAMEMLAVMENKADEKLVKESLDGLDQQRVRVEERLQLLADNEGNIDEAELTRVQNRYEKQVEEQLMNMQKVQNQYKNVGEETKKGFEDAVMKMNNNMEENNNNNMGEGTEQNENNQESNGNVGTNENSGSSNGGGNGGN